MQNRRSFLGRLTALGLSLLGLGKAEGAEAIRVLRHTERWTLGTRNGKGHHVLVGEATLSRIVQGMDDLREVKQQIAQTDGWKCWRSRFGDGEPKWCVLLREPKVRWRVEVEVPVV